MAGEQFPDDLRGAALGDMLGLLLNRAVAEGAVAMAQVTDGTPEHEHWLTVAQEAVPLADEYLQGVQQRRSDSENDETALVSESIVAPDMRAEKQERLAELEAEAALLRQELEQ